MPANRLIGEHANEGQVAIPFVVIKPITDDKFVGNVKADVFRFNRPLAADILSKKDADLEAQRAAFRGETFANDVQRHAAVEDVVENQNMTATSVGELSLAKVYLAGALGAVIARYTQAIDLKVQGDPAKEVRHENEAAIQNSNNGEVLSTVVLRDFAGEFIKPAQDGGLVVKNFSDVSEH